MKGEQAKSAGITKASEISTMSEECNALSCTCEGCVEKDKRIAELEAQLVRVLEWHEVSCYDELPFVIDELREGETALNGEGK